ncbi:zinc finger, CCHC-type [Artemisia annua]|uniref:Zinc finger, CCHC-type n=1 Tax=Artemisia annua TaxID=35608 RepID=A0A2U1KSA6_ARTAN|nr:zinc finger, CCHC-type [Artemisia annua]
MVRGAETVNHIRYKRRMGKVEIEALCDAHKEKFCKEKRQVRKLLGSVPEKFIQIVAAIEQFADLNKMSFQEAVGRLKAFEERTKKAVKEEDGSSSLFFSKVDEKEKTKEHKCEYCGCGNASQKDFGRGQGRGRGSGRSQGDDEANLIQYEDDEPTLLYTSCKDEEEDLI